MNEFIKITYNDFRKMLLQKILENNDFIINSSQIIKVILENVIDSNPEMMENNLDLIKEENSQIFRKINNTQNNFLDEIIMNILERKVRYYFKYIPKLRRETKEQLYPKYFKDNKNTNFINETGIIFDNSLNIFKQTIEFLDSISSFNENNDNQNDNIHLCKLYSIVYIKMYLSKAVFFIKEKHSQIGSIKELMKVIQSIKNKNFGKVIKIYVFKLFYYYIL